MNSRRKIVALTLLAIAIILIPTAAVAAQSNTANAPAKHYPRGTICGNAQLGSWSGSWTGSSTYQGLYSVFGINNMVLSGGNRGSVTSTNGYLDVYNHEGGHLLLAATFSGLSGTYTISGSKMKLQHFQASTIQVGINQITGHAKDSKVKPGTFHNANIPAQTLACTTNENYVS
jgi:hypothetical protein